MSGNVARGALALVLLVMVPACGMSGGNATLTPTVAPAEPTNVISLAGNRRVKLTWDPSPAASRYQVRRANTPLGPFDPLPSGQDITATTFIDTGLANGTTYYYVVSAANALGTSGDSDVVGAGPGLRGMGISTGTETCFVRLQDGSLWSWGNNSKGQLGAGISRSFSNVALEVTLPGVVGVWGGSAHTLALTSDGAVWAWGMNGSGQLGNPTGVDTNVPIPIPGLADVVTMTTKLGSSLALLADGTVWSWGGNSFGELGFGHTPGYSVPTPTQVPGLSEMKDISMGLTHGLALRQDGTVWAWGSNDLGQLGIGTADAIVRAPIQVHNLTDIVAIAAGYRHSLALRSNGSVWAWGSNLWGQIGNSAIPPGFGANVPIATPVSLLSGVSQIAAGEYHSLALRADGTVWGWGINSYGVLGKPVTTTHSTVPILIDGLIGIREISSGAAFGLAQDAGGVLWAWGNNHQGQLGSGTGAIQDSPVQVANLTAVTAVSSGYIHNLGIRTDGRAWAWGENARGSLGSGTPIMYDYNRVPVSLTLPAGVTVTGVSAGGFHSLALLSNGTVWGWGADYANGFTTDRSTPAQVATPPGVTAISAGNGFSLGLLGTGSVYFWGRNSDGQRGNGTNGGDIANPVPVSITGVKAITAGYAHCLALKTDGTVWGWGNNASGITGSPGLSVWSPLQVQGIDSVVSVSAGFSVSYALRSDGTVWAWGYNDAGQLGTNSVSQSTTPIQVADLTNVTAISAGGAHGLALTSAGEVWAWGTNITGQLGRNSPEKSSIPLLVPGIVGATGIDGGTSHSTTILADGTVWSWGYNISGQVGIGTGGSSTIPLRVTH